jgi:hypothetical protein
MKERQKFQELQLRKAIDDATQKISGALSGLKLQSDQRQKDRAQYRELGKQLENLQRTVALLDETFV